MKRFLQTRTLCMRFLHGNGREMVENWSKSRQSHFRSGHPNPNCRYFSRVPTMKPKDWKYAFDFESKKHSYHRLSSDMYCTSDSIRLITKQHGLELLEYIGNVKSETAFDELIQKISEIRLIKLNMEQWMLSSCTCAGWHKYLKCVHITTLAYILKMIPMDEYNKFLPVAPKKKRGALSKTVKALQYQPSDIEELGDRIFNNELDDEEEMNALVLEAEDEEEENQVEEPQTTQKEPQKKKRDKKRRTLLKIHGIPGQKGLLFVIILLLLRELNIKLFYSNFILFKLTIFYNTL